MYLIAVLETVGGFFMLIPKFRPFASIIITVVMIAAMLIKVLFGIIDGIDTDGFYAVIRSLDLFFFFSIISTILYLSAYDLGEKPHRGN